MAQPYLPKDTLRERFDLYLNPSERAAIHAKARRVSLPMSVFIRKAALGHKVQAPPPAINLMAWQHTARLSANLNQIAHSIASGRATGVDVTTIAALADAVRSLRLALLGTSERDPDGGTP